MPRVWVVNVEESAPPEDADFESVFAPTVSRSCVRFLFCMDPGDLLISPVEIPEDFRAYVRRVSGATPGHPEVRTLQSQTRPYSLIDSVFQDAALMGELARLGRQGDWVLEPYIESRKALDLCEDTGMRMDKTRPEFILNGTILRLNDKAYFRSLARELGIPTVPGYLATDRRSLLAAIDRVSRENGDRICLKKTRYSGGMGNLYGGRAELLLRLPAWYNHGEVLVEHALPFRSVAGTLMTLAADSVRFWGVDEQRFTDQRWTGLDYPHPDRATSDELCRLSLRIAATVHEHRARGDLNLDWGLLPDGRPILLECNFRHNGLGQILRFMRRYFGPAAERKRVRYHVRLRLRYPDLGLAGLFSTLAGLSCAGEPLLIDSPGRTRGVVVMMPPQDGYCSLAVFADESAYIAEASRALTEALLDGEAGD